MVSTIYTFYPPSNSASRARFIFSVLITSPVIQMFLHMLLGELETKLAMSFVQPFLDDVLWCIPTTCSRFLHHATRNCVFMNFGCIGEQERLLWEPSSSHLIYLYITVWERPSSLSISLLEKSIFLTPMKRPPFAIPASCPSRSRCQLVSLVFTSDFPRHYEVLDHQTYIFFCSIYKD